MPSLIQVLRNVVYFDELTKSGANSARNYITKELDRLYILKSMKKYHLAVSYMESLSSMMKKTVEEGSVKSPLHKRLQRQATRQKWTSVRAKVLTLAKQVDILVQKFETRWNIEFVVKKSSGERVPFRDSDWRAKEYEIKSLPVEMDRTYYTKESETSTKVPSSNVNYLHEMLKKKIGVETSEKMIVGEEEYYEENEDLKSDSDFEFNRHMRTDAIRDSEQVLGELDSSMSEIREMYDNMKR